MVEYHGERRARLGWLIDTARKARLTSTAPICQWKILDRPESLSGDPELPGFTLNLQPIWEPGR